MLVLLAACATDREPAAILWANELDDGRLRIHVNTCKGGPEVTQVVETSERVEVTVVADVQDDGPRPACADGVVVELEDPLGARTLTSGVTNEPVTIRD